MMRCVFSMDRSRNMCGIMVYKPLVRSLGRDEIVLKLIQKIHVSMKLIIYLSGATIAILMCTENQNISGMFDQKIEVNSFHPCNRKRPETYPIKTVTTTMKKSIFSITSCWVLLKFNCTLHYAFCFL